MRVAGLVAALIFIVLGGYGVQDCAAHESLACERAGGRPRCVATAGVLASETTRFEGDALAGLRAIEHKGKGRPTYAVAVIDRAGTSREVVRRLDELDARRAEAWFAGNEAQVEVEHPRYVNGIVLAAGLIAVGLGFGIAALRRSRERPVPAG